MRNIVPFLWFDDNAEAAAKFYVSTFRNSRIVNVTRYGETAARAAGRAEGTVMTVEFTIDGQEFVALNGGPQFAFSPATSFVVNCRTQDEIDALWERLSSGGIEMQCGWVTDRYGITWQIVPAAIGKMVSDPDPERAQRVFQALLTMTKIDLDALERAYGRKLRAVSPRRRTPRLDRGKPGRSKAGARVRGKRAAA